MCGTHGFRTSHQNRVVDEIGGAVDHAFAAGEFTVGPHHHEIRDPRLVVGNAIPEHPETIFLLRIACADVSVTEISPAQGSEDAVAECNGDLALLTDLFGRSGLVFSQRDDVFTHEFPQTFWVQSSLARHPSLFSRE